MSKGRHLTTDDRERIVAAYGDGATIDALANDFDVDRKTVLRLLLAARRNGDMRAEKRSAVTVAHEVREAVLDRWAAGMQRAAIAAETGAADQTIKYIIATSRNAGDERAARHRTERGMREDVTAAATEDASVSALMDLDEIAGIPVMRWRGANGTACTLPRVSCLLEAAE